MIACFISPHGFGHAARASAVMEAVGAIDPSIRFDIFTSVPKWFFDQSLSLPFAYHCLVTDVGMSQKTAFQEDLAETLRLLDELLPFDGECMTRLAKKIKGLGCRMVLCDISPMGILVAREAGIPSVLVENFTWDWIYRGYRRKDARIEKHIDYLGKIFGSADHHIQARPACAPAPGSFVVGPVSRKTKAPPEAVRARLGIRPDRPVVLITTGGVPEKQLFLKRLEKTQEAVFILPGANGPVEAAFGDHIVALPFHSDFFHPDLVNASNAVVGKAGYSTLAETYHAGVPFGYVTRPDFCESCHLAAYIRKEMMGLEITETDFRSGHFLSSLNDLLSLPRMERKEPNGADQVAEFVVALLENQCRQSGSGRTLDNSRG